MVSDEDELKDSMGYVRFARSSIRRMVYAGQLPEIIVPLPRFGEVM